MKNIDNYIQEKLYIGKEYNMVVDRETFEAALEAHGCKCAHRSDLEVTLFIGKDHGLPFIMLVMYDDYWMTMYATKIHVCVSGLSKEDVTYDFDIFDKYHNIDDKFNYNLHNVKALVKLLKENDKNR